MKEFKESGDIRINRLSYYHKVESLGDAIGDLNEGKSIVNLNVDHFEKTNHNQMPSALSLALGQLGEGAVIRNFKMTNTTVSNPHYFCLSLSEVRSKALLDKFNADAIIEIKNPIKFFKALSSSIPTFDHALFSPCDYSGRTKNYSMNKHDDSWKNYSLLKDVDYEYQKEVRAVWSIPGISDSDHISLKSQKAANYCKFYFDP